MARGRKRLYGDDAEYRQSKEEYIKGKIGALHRAGWSLSKIMGEMHMTAEEVLQVLNEVRE